MLGAIKGHKYIKRHGFILMDQILVWSDSPDFVFGGNDYNARLALYDFSLKHSLCVEMILLG